MGEKLPKSGKQNLSHQLFYRFDYNKDAKVAIFVAMFGTAFSVASSVYPKNLVIDDPADDEVPHR